MFLLAMPLPLGLMLLRMGNDQASMAGIKDFGFSLKFESIGLVTPEFADVVNADGRGSPSTWPREPGLPSNVALTFQCRAGPASTSSGSVCQKLLVV